MKINKIEDIRGRFELNYVGVTDESVLYEQILDDIASLLILFDAQKHAKNLIIEDILYWVDNVDSWWVDNPNAGGYDFEKLRGLL